MRALSNGLGLTDWRGGGASLIGSGSQGEFYGLRFFGNRYFGNAYFR